MPRLPGPDEPHFFARDPASEVLRTQRAAEDEAALRALDSALLRRRAEVDAQPLDEDDLEFGPLSGPADAPFDDRVQDLVDPFAGSRVEARARSLADTHRKAFEARASLTGHQRGERGMVKTLERVLEDTKQAVALQPDLIDVALARADTALDKTATQLNWSDEERTAQRNAFDKDLAARLLRTDIAKGNTQTVIQELDNDDLALDPEVTATLRREAQTAQDRARSAFQADADAALGGLDTIDGDALIAQANGILAVDEQAAFAERVRQAQADTAFRNAIRFVPPEAIGEFVDCDPLLEASNDRACFQLLPMIPKDPGRRQTLIEELLDERAQDPAGYLMEDPTVAGWFTDRVTSEVALSRRLQAQADIGIETPKVLPRDEARTMAAELNALPPAARMARLTELQQVHGEHHDAALGELAAQGLDRPARALAAAQDHPALALALVDAQTIGRAGLREGLDPEETEALDAAIAIALGNADANGFRFAIEDLAFRNYKQTGDVETAAKDALALAANGLGIEVQGASETSPDLNVASIVKDEEFEISDTSKFTSRENINSSTGAEKEADFDLLDEDEQQTGTDSDQTVDKSSSQDDALTNETQSASPKLPESQAVIRQIGHLKNLCVQDRTDDKEKTIARISRLERRLDRNDEKQKISKKNVNIALKKIELNEKFDPLIVRAYSGDLEDFRGLSDATKNQIREKVKEGIRQGLDSEPFQNFLKSNPTAGQMIEFFRNTEAGQEIVKKFIEEPLEETLGKKFDETFDSITGVAFKGAQRVTDGVLIAAGAIDLLGRATADATAETTKRANEHFEEARIGTTIQLEIAKDRLKAHSVLDAQNAVL